MTREEKRDHCLDVSAQEVMNQIYNYKYSEIPILRPPLGLSKSGLLDSPKGGL